MTRPVERYESSAGHRIYRLPLEVFPDFWGYAHLVVTDDERILIDTGSGFGDSNDHLQAGLRQVRHERGEKLGLEDLDYILITHGHIDHFGGLPYVLERSQASLGVHALDLRVLTNYEERLTVVGRRLRDYLVEAGVEADQRDDLMDLYMVSKHLFSSVEVDFTFDAQDMRVGPLQVIHVPGHSSGQVVLRLDDVLFSGDHVLKGISPHQAPERLSLHTGLSHYLDSLRKLKPLAPAIRLTLGGHEGPIDDLGKRLEEIEWLHMGRLESVLELFEEPKTVAQIARQLFPEASGYHVLLALEEAGAHIEYLSQRGRLGIDNLDDLKSDQTLPIRYRRLDLPGAHAPVPARSASGIAGGNPHEE